MRTRHSAAVLSEPWHPAGPFDSEPDLADEGTGIVDGGTPIESDPALHAEAAPQLEAAAGDADEGRRGRIAERAYLRAERRDFAPGQELDDWLAAEGEEDGPPDARNA